MGATRKFSIAARVVVVMLVTSSFLAGPAAEGRPRPSRSTRVETAAYSASPTGTVSTDHGTVYAEVRIDGGPERYVQIEIADDSAPAVAAVVAQDENLSHPCSATQQPIAITPNQPVTVVIMVGRCSDGTPSIPTEGVVTATFFRKVPGPRTQTEAYSPTTGGAVVRNITATSAGISVVQFAGGTEEFVTIEIDDEAGLPVSATIAQADDLMDFCGSTPEPVRVAPHEPIYVYLFNGPCAGSGSVTTRGSVTATFSRS